MRITVNGRPTEMPAAADAAAVRARVKPGAELVIVNGAVVDGHHPVRDGDEVTLIRRGEVPAADELEALMVARHTPGVPARPRRACVGSAGLGGRGTTAPRGAAPVGSGAPPAARPPAKEVGVYPGQWSRVSGGGDAACAARGSEVLCRGVGLTQRFDAGGEVVALAVGGSFVVWATGRGVEVRPLTPDAATPVGAALAGVEALSASRKGWCAVAAGAVHCAGGNSVGQLGDGTALERRGAVQVLGVSGAVRVISSDRWSCAHRWSGDLMCWGDGPDRGVRRGLATPQPGPIAREVTARGGALCSGGDVVRCGELAVSALAGASGLSGTATHVCGIADGAVVCDALAPASRVAATAVAATTTGGCALTADGVVCWGM
jgi:sulfur carrier protein ThiS